MGVVATPIFLGGGLVFLNSKGYLILFLQKQINK